MCAGMNLARLEMEVMLEALIEADAQLVAGAAIAGVNRNLDDTGGSMTHGTQLEIWTDNGLPPQHWVLF